MKIACFFLLSAIVVLVESGNGVQYDLRDAPFLFLKFVKDYNRQYQDTADTLLRYAKFIISLNTINKSNALSTSAVFDINKFADYTDEELDKLVGAKVGKYSFLLYVIGQRNGLCQSKL